MKTTITIMISMFLIVALGCTSPRGGGMSEDKGFKIAVPLLTTDIKQGDRQTVTVSLQRGKFFKEDVQLQIKASSGIDVQPAQVLVKASDTPEVQLQIAASKDAAIGEYRVYIKGTPETGEPTSIEFKAKVVAP